MNGSGQRKLRHRHPSRSQKPLEGFVRLSRRALIALLSGLLILPLVPGVALGGIATFSASAGLAPVRQLVGDSAGSLYRLTVRNTGDGSGIGAVQINRPSSFWTVAACPGAPAGW